MTSFDHSTLYREAELIFNNFKTSNDQLNETYLAAEMVNGLFRDIIFEELVYPDPEPWQEASVLISFGAYQSWIMSYINACAGLSDISKMILRRAIEFACYLSKIKTNNERAQLWFKKSKDLKNRKQFSNIFTVPNKYFTEKYSHLRPLLVVHDRASEIAVHANFATLISKFQRDDSNQIVTLSIQDSNYTDMISIGMVLVAGYKLIETLIIVLKDEFENPDDVNEKFETLKEMIRRARLSIAELDYRGNIPSQILSDINTESNMDLKEQFEALKIRYQSEV